MSKAQIKSATLTLYSSLADALEQNNGEFLIAACLDDEGCEIGYTILTKWLADRPKVTLNKLTIDTGACNIDSFKVMTIEGINAAKVAKAPKIVEVVKVAKAAKAPKASGIESDSSTEQGLVEKYGDRIIVGSVRFDTEGKYTGKRTVEIRCYQLFIDTHKWNTAEFSGEVRRIATSDLFQVFGTEFDHNEKRKADRRFAHKMRAVGLSK